MKNCNKRFLSFFILAFLFLLFLSPWLAKADPVILNQELTSFMIGANLGNVGLGTVVGRIVKAILSVLGLICLIIFIMAGFQWMSSGGHKEKIAGAQKSMGAAIIGMLITIGAYAAVDFITRSLSTVAS